MTAERLTNPILVAFTGVAETVASPLMTRQASSQSGAYVRDLERRHALVLAQLSELDQLKEENQALKSLLGSSGVGGSGALLERRSIAVPLSSLVAPMVAAGFEDGVAVGSVVTAEMTLVGIVREVSARQARVDLLTSPLERPILARTESGAQGLVVGDGRRILLTEVSRQAELNPGERVVTVGQEGIGRNILIGTIRSVENRPSAPTQTAFIDQYISFYEAVIVEIW
jgi:cell shape-determining protein MreC